MTVYTSAIIYLSSIDRPASEANYWNSNARSTGSAKGVMAYHASLSHILFYDIINRLIGHYTMACPKRSGTHVF